MASSIIISSRNWNGQSVALNGKQIYLPVNKPFEATPEVLALLDQANPPVAYTKVQGIADAAGEIGLGSFARAVPIIGNAGDSRIAYHLGTPSSNDPLIRSTRGPLNWARYKMGRRFEAPNSLNFGIVGTQIAVDNGAGDSLLTRLPSILAALKAAGGTILNVICDVNDVTQRRTGDQMIADMTAVLNMIMNAGITPIVNTSINGAGAWDSAQTRAWLRYYNWQKTLSRDPRIILIDAWQRVADRSSTTDAMLGTGPNAYCYATTHFGPRGGEAIGDDYVAALDRLLPPPIWRGVSSSSDSYHATENPGGVLSGATRFYSAGGSLTDPAGNAGSAATGTVGSSARIYKDNGALISVVGSCPQTVNVPINGANIAIPGQQITITSGGTGKTTAYIQLPDILMSGGNYAPGDQIYFEAFVNMLSSTGVYGCSLVLQEINGSGFGTVIQQAQDMAPVNSGGTWFYLLDRARSGWQRTPSITIGSGSDRIRGMLVVDCDAATVNAIVQLAAIAVRKIIP